MQLAHHIRKHRKSRGLSQSELARRARLSLPNIQRIEAGTYFLKKQKGFEEELVELYHSRRLKIYRPDANLFVKLKLAQLSESDLADCLEMLSRFGREANHSQFLKIIQKEKKAKNHRAERLVKLISALKT